MARSRIAPKRQLSIPRLELCAALSGAQLANLLSSELTIPIQSVTLWTDSTTVLHTVMVEVGGILNSKPLGYISSDLADPDPVTPNMLLMGRPDASLPQAIYCESELLRRRRRCYSQILADHFWTAFILQYLPDEEKVLSRTRRTAKYLI